MPNKNYRAGRALEYERRKHWESEGYTVVRSAGSHGPWDLCAVPTNPAWPVLLIQEKRVDNLSAAKRLLKNFRAEPPFKPSSHYHQVMEVKVKGTKEVMSFTV